MNTCMKHIAEQLVFVCQNIVRLDGVNTQQQEEIDRKVNIRTFDSTFKAESKKIENLVDQKSQQRKGF